MPFLEIKHINAEHLNSAVELDRLCFGGLWTIEGYRRELDSPNSDLLGLWVSDTGAGVAETFDSELEPVDIFTPQNAAGTGAPPLQTTETLIGLGCLWAILEEAHITILAIDPRFQGQGLGQALLWALLKSANRRQLERATLEVRASNLVALSLYHKFGFQEAGRRKRYYADTGEDAAIMWRNGLEKPQFEQYLAKEKVKICDRLQEKKWHWAIDTLEF
ncbi:MAG: ribosomal protein S18-alanine N-acetyltransferase [Microcoleus sp. PH2017_22_RUC_O_B]|uniref:ribosomal protein S18-alanine N-acetyltransferase n=1 Tax=unclassified Microcoleus TaxID=2642155 RepID=UPI001D3EF367|nr:MULTISPECIES: ribosomal protein S18-alanine N-acetyltransferase [unclassified Microcoleus]MCC3528438.1 ribosomal protein S18-alanine N-acetyltransferase [Microcoleus sp. PH2017_21_RUC_O_A]MCC3540614.1 ribosomal protein S18-alanine N-acetyltransferase [Microcoleus sp. PH2017_22_RUC_O_B]